MRTQWLYLKAKWKPLNLQKKSVGSNDNVGRDELTWVKQETREKISEQ